MDLSTMNSLFEHAMQDLYSAKKQIVEVLPKMVNEASSQELQSAFQEHLTVTEMQIKRLQAVMHQLEASLKVLSAEG